MHCIPRCLARMQLQMIASFSMTSLVAQMKCCQDFCLKMSLSPKFSQCCCLQLLSSLSLFLHLLCPKLYTREADIMITGIFILNQDAASFLENCHPDYAISASSCLFKCNEYMSATDLLHKIISDLLWCMACVSCHIWAKYKHVQEYAGDPHK